MEPREAPGPVASVVAVVTVGFAAGWVTRQLRSRLRLPFWVAPIVGITVAGVLHSQLDEPVANLLARRRR